MDGRLDLDDLGQVVENATLLDGAPDRDDVTGGNDGPTWAERAAPARRFLRRHRLAVAAATAAALVVGAGAAAWQVRRPPPPATELAATLTFNPDRAGIELLDDSLIRFSARVSPQRPGETARVLGLVGTGIAASRATNTGIGTYDVTAVVDCGLDPDVTTGRTSGQYLVAVATTDQYGRTLQGRLPMAGVSDTLGPQLTQTCAQLVADTGVLTRVTAARRDGGSLALTVSVRNSTEHRVVLAAGPRSGTVDVSASPVALGRGRDRFWDVRLTPTDCADPRLDQVTPDGTLVDGLPDAEPAFEAAVNLPDDSGGSYFLGGSYRLVRLGPATRAWRSWVNDTCRGRDPVTARVVGASAPVPAPSAEDPGRLASTLRVRVRQPAAAVTLAQAADPWNGDAVRLASPGFPDVAWSAGAGTGPRTATLTLQWFFSCSSDLSPPQLAATATYGDGTRAPWLLRLDDASMGSLLRTSCPDLLPSDEELASWGWQTAATTTLLPR